MAEHNSFFETQICEDFTYPSDFSYPAFNNWADRAGYAQRDSASIIGILEEIGAAEIWSGDIIFSNAGVLMFADNPVNFLRKGEIDFITVKGNSKLDKYSRQMIKAPAMLAIDETVAMISSIENSAYYLPAVEEAVRNAVIHRDWHLNGRIMLEMYSDRIEITSHGGLAPGITQENMLTSRYSRNPVLAGIFEHAKQTEDKGLEMMVNGCAAAGLPEPVFEIADSYVRVTFLTYS